MGVETFFIKGSRDNKTGLFFYRYRIDICDEGKVETLFLESGS